MQPLKISGFSGIAPMISPRKLAPTMAQVADNCRLFTGDLSSWRRPGVIATGSKALQGTIKSIFRVNNDGVDTWLNWLTDVDCVRGPIAGDTTQRIYFTGDGEPRISNAALAASTSDFPGNFYVLGVFAPTVAPTVNHTGGAAANVTRYFAYTYVTQWGEESQPSLPTAHTAPGDATWDITGMQVAPANSFVITGGSWVAGVATVTVASTFGLRADEEIGVTGTTPGGYDVAKTPITALTSTTISYALADDPGAWSAGGTVARTAPHNVASMKKRIYVTADTGTADTDFLFWVEKNASDTSHSATVLDAELGEVMSSAAYAMPPADMKGLIEFENGVLVGFSKNEVCPCEPYRPHAWPTAYRQSTNRDIVGIGSFSRAIVVGTKAQPYALSGTHPENYTLEKINRNEPCLSKRGVTSFPFGVIYPSVNGLMLVGVEGATLVTDGILSKREWTAFNPASLHAQEYQGRYFAWYEAGDGVIKGFVFDRSGRGPNMVTYSVPATASYTDPETGELYVVDAGKVKLWDGDTLNNLPYDWFSKIVALPKPINLGYAKVEADYAALGAADLAAAQAQQAMDTAFNATILDDPETHPGQGKTQGEFNGAGWNHFMWNGSLLIGGDYPNYDNRTLVFQLYARNSSTDQMELRHTEYPVSNKPFSLPSGYEETDYAVRVSGNIDAASVELAETAEQLEQV